MSSARNRPDDHFRWLPELEIIKIRRYGPRFGWISLAVGFILFVAIIMIGINILPWSGSTSNMMPTIVGTLPVSMLIISSVVAFYQPNSVVSGYLKWRDSYFSKAISIVLFVFSFPFLLLFYLSQTDSFGYVSFVPTSGLVVLMYEILPALAVVPLAVNMWFVVRIVRLSNESYRLYGAVPWQRLHG